ncbi:MAG: hypothetical protein ACJ763_12190 [Bdellovibrionia bacterium]
MRFLVLAGCLLIAGMTHAGSGGIRDGGNGGDAVVCRNSSGAIQKIEMLDVLEARTLYGLSPKLGASNLSIEQKLETVFQQIERLNPTRAKRYREAIQGWALNKIEWTQDELKDIPDSDHNLIPVGCKIEQIAIRQDPDYDYYHRGLVLTVQQNLWRAMDLDNQAALILHELFYWDTQHLTFITNSRPARYLNALAFSGQLAALDSAAFFKLAKEYLPDVDYAGWVIDPRSLELYPDGKMKKATDGGYNHKLADIVIQGQTISAERVVEFRPDGHVSHTMISDPKTLMTRYGKAKISGELDFDSNDVVVNFDQLEETTPLVIGDAHFSCDRGEVKTWDGLELRCLVTAQSEVLSPRMKLKVVKGGKAVFDKYGLKDIYPKTEFTGQLTSSQGQFRFKRLYNKGHYEWKDCYDATCAGELDGPHQVVVDGTRISIAGRVEFANFERLLYLEPQEDFIFHGIPVASRVKCGFVGSKVVPTVFFIGQPAQMVLSERMSWTVPFEKKTVSADAGDMVTFYYGYSNTPYEKETKHWCDVYKKYFPEAP